MTLHRARPLGAVVRVVGQRARPPIHRLQAGKIVVGAGREADVIVDDPRISRAHVELRLVPEGVEARDLESRNGTFYLGQRIHHAVLALGSRITIGDAEIVLDADRDDLTLVGGLERYRGLLGASPASQRLFATLARLEGSLVTVLLEGPSGVGKELVARALHEGSALAEKPLIVVNCATLVGDLARSELFGHRRGAFTGAVEDRMGAFEAADGGTVFLDEVGELPLEVQPMLLRALEAGEVVRVGDHQARRVKVRVIAATNRVLEGQVAVGGFRDDLFYRLAVVRLRIAPLDERPEDIPVLARHFARQVGRATLSEDVVAALAARRWPGNARELRNAVQAYAALGVLPETAEAATGALDHLLRQLVDLEAPFNDQKQAIADRFGRIYFEVLLERAGGNRSEAARIAGLDRSYFGKLLAKHGFGPKG
jgi:two-component system, NtrC family, response regulator GlrR